MHDAPEPAHRAKRSGNFRSEESSGEVVITFSEIISALSFAIDLTEHAVPGHALRSCLLGMRMGRALGLPSRELASLYYASLLKDVGCSKNASRFSEAVCGDERVTRSGGDDFDPRRAPAGVAKSTLNLVRKEVRSAHPSPRASEQETILLRCERGASIARKLGLSAATCEAVFALDERWDGFGSPLHLQATAIPLLARVVAVAEHLDAFACEHTPSAAMAALREDNGRRFDPELVVVATALDHSGQLWTQCLPADDLDVTRKLVIDLDPERSNGVGAAEIDRICEAFAEVVDAKSPFTYRHSLGVAQVAVATAAGLSLPPDRLRMVHRAALLHDLGKLSVPNTILEKTGRLDPAEWRTMMEHPRLTQQILARIEPFAELAEIAGAHHEKLDGSGYPNGLREPELRMESRVIAVADIYRALTEGRPYRPGVSHAAAVAKLRELTPHQLDVRCVDALDLCCDPARGTAAATLEGPTLLRKGPVPAQVPGFFQALTA